MYTVLFHSWSVLGTPESEDHRFMSSFPDYLIARNVARNLEEEGFVAKAWVEAE